VQSLVSDSREADTTMAGPQGHMAREGVGTQEVGAGRLSKVEKRCDRRESRGRGAKRRWKSRRAKKSQGRGRRAVQS
jgi:hypothetical protein